MKRLQSSILLGVLLGASSLLSNDAGNGKDLYFKAKCQECHTPEDYISEKRKVKDFAKLQWRVKRCGFTMGAGWFDEDIDDVVKYLNENYYKFKTDKAGKKQ